MLKRTFLYFVILISLFITTAEAQTTGFVYQGKLSDGATAANGTYQFTFKLYDAASGGNQVGQAISDLPATVTNGIFAVKLDFGASAFDGSPRFLEISVRLNNSGQAYTLLNPRQAVASTPYAVRSLNANQAVTADNSANLGGIPAAQYTQTTDPRLSDDRNPLPDSPNYIQNTANQQASSNFNISGFGKANVLDAKTQYNLNGERVLHISGANNVFAGVNAGKNTTGFANAFFGYSAGMFNTTGQDNSFFGQAAGINNTTGNANSFFGNGAGFYNTNGTRNSFYGYLAGQDNSSGSYNAFFGSTSGIKNTTGINNAFVGQASGYNNTIGSNNAFFGNSAGMQNTTGAGNVFLGAQSGESNTTESNNIFIGFKADGTAGITNATAIGANSKATQSNTIVLGTGAVTVQVPGNLTVFNTFSANALDSATVYKIGGARILSNAGTDNLFAGIDSGSVNTGGFNAFFGALSGKANTTGFNNTFVGAYAGRDNTSGKNNAFFGASAGLSNTLGASNSFFGANAGFSNLGGSDNSFFGNLAGFNNTTGLNNSFFGRSSGMNVTNAVNNAFFGAFSGENTTTGGNSFFGANAGQSNTTGFNNTFIGANSGSTGNVNNSIAIGANVKVATSNTALIGTSSMTVKLPGAVDIAGNAAIGSATIGSASINSASIGTTLNVGGLLTANGDLNVGDDLSVTGGITAAAISSDDGNFDQLSVTQFLSSGAVMQGQTFISTIKYGSLNGAGGESDFICRGEMDGILRPCYAFLASQMKNTSGFNGGFNVLKDLRAVSFNLEGETRRSLGLVLNDTAATNSIFARPSAGNLVTGTRYFDVVAALVDTAQQQQTRLEAQTAENQKLQAQIKQLQSQMDALKAIVCAQSGAAVCQPKN